MAPTERENDSEMPLSQADDDDVDQNGGDDGRDAPSENEDEGNDSDDCSDL